MSIGFYAGSFDPFTNGHLHIVSTASKMFDKIIVGIGVNETKTRKYDKQLMQQAINKTFLELGITNAECIVYSGLTVDKANELNCNFLIRGLRNSKDYEAEENLAKINYKLGGLDTIFIRANDYDIISSTLVNELKKEGKDYSSFVPKQIYEIMK